jgi:predicted nucleotidyltransferase
VSKSSVTARLTEKRLINPPPWLPNAVAYETIMGSVAYGVSSDTSDMDVYGFCLPPKEMVFPHLAGEISGFGRQIERFEQFEQHHVRDDDALGGSGREYDLTIYSIVKFFQLAMENNPNVIDSLFTPVTCVLHSTRIGEMVRERRRDFLHKGAWPKFKGYAYSQIARPGLGREDVEVSEVREFEANNHISHDTTLEEVEEEMRRRGLLAP